MSSENSDCINNKSNKRSNNGELISNDRIGEEWIAASRTRNSALDDKCLDYFEMYHVNDINDRPVKRQRTGCGNNKDEEPINATSFNDYILRSGIQFEKDIISQLQNKFKNDFIKICEPYEAIFVHNCVKTFETMKKGIPIIYQGVVHNPTKMHQEGDEKTFGAVDLLVRSDWINKLVNYESITKDEMKISAPKLKRPYHYCVVDIKWTKLHLNVNCETIRNNINVKPFKTQLTIYNNALGYMQGYTPDSAYILGNGWICDKMRRGNKITMKSNNPFDRLGKIDFRSFDKVYNEKASDAIIWYRGLQNQTTMTHDPPSQIELCPNMKNTHDGRFHHIKEQLAIKNFEITQLWNCGVREREVAYDMGVKSWNDKLFSANLVGLREGKRQKVIDTMVSFNRDSTDLVYTKCISATSAWKDTNSVEFYVDFETIQENLVGGDFVGDFIFMIGIRCMNVNPTNYVSITTKELTMQSEKATIDEFIKIIETLSGNKKSMIFHWGQHEKVVFGKAIARHGNIWKMPNFVDFCRIMTDLPILVRGAYGFGLKSIGKAMYRHSLIQTTWTGDVSDGSNAMFLGWKEYKKLAEHKLPYKNITDSPIIREIIEYNKIDCITMYEIIQYFKGINQHKEMTTINVNNNVDMSDNSDVEQSNNNTHKRLNHPSVSKTSDVETAPKKKRVINDDDIDNIVVDLPMFTEVDTEPESSSDDDTPQPPLRRFSKRLSMRKFIVPDTYVSSDDSDYERKVNEENINDVSDMSDDSVSEDEEPADVNSCILEALVNKFFEYVKDKYPRQDNFNEIKKILLERMVKIEEIHDLENITDMEKADLVEKFLKCVTNADLEGFIHERNDLKKLISGYRTVDLEERKKFENIKNELECSRGDSLSLEKRILLLDLDTASKKIIYDKYKQLTMMSSGSDSYAKLKEWIEHVVRIPFNIIHPINDNDMPIRRYLLHVKKVLDENLFGMVKAKEELLMILNNKLRDPESFKNTIAFVGPPGTGKTALVLALCKALNLPYNQISLGGKHDSSFFLGHSYTYEGSQPGQLVTSLQKMGCKNGILFFDEFDKLEDREGRKGVSDLLLHVTDFTQNDKFTDEYVASIPIDLSKLWFIFSLNDVNKIDPILRNRMKFINVPSYNDEEKKTIVSDYIIPKFNKQYKFNSTDIVFTDEIIKYIIKKTKKEDGVREIERNLNSIYVKVNLLRSIYDEVDDGEVIDAKTLGITFDIENFKLPFQLTTENIDNLIKEEKKDDKFIKETMMYL